MLTGNAPGATLLERGKLLDAGGGHLSIAAARDDLAGGPSLLDDAARKTLDEVITFATEANPIQRADNALEWLDFLLQAATAPAAKPAPNIDPLEARPTDVLPGKLEVKRLLGTGATARVLAVEREGSLFALKVPLAPELEDRLRAEAEVLRKLRSERIVEFKDTPMLGGRLCLLTSYGGETLADLLKREGPPSLDYARRWGDDLLRALEFLEDEGVQHRDIKPANVGVLPSQSKRQRHLYLFDFSLSMLDPVQTTVGTPAYRDPFVPLRGRWDEAADRFSAAITLYELLTGTRPRWGKGDVPATAGQEEMSLDAERFDTAVRGRLVPFFRRAFARDARRLARSAPARVGQDEGAVQACPRALRPRPRAGRAPHRGLARREEARHLPAGRLPPALQGARPLARLSPAAGPARPRARRPGEPRRRRLRGQRRRGPRLRRAPERPPERPALDALVRPLGLEWSEERGVYTRPGALPSSTAHTLAPPRPLPTYHGSRRPTRDPLVQEAREFEERLRLAANRRLFRVIEVNCAYADEVARRLSHELGLRAISLDQAILREADAVTRAWEIPDPSVLVEADRQGPSGPDWPNLRDLMRESAERVVRDLAAKSESVLLTQPGLLGRYRLDGVLATLLEATQKDDGPAVFLLVPAYDDPGPAPIDAVPQPMPIPQSSPAQRLRVPEAWIENRHRVGG